MPTAYDQTVLQIAGPPEGVEDAAGDAARAGAQGSTPSRRARPQVTAQGEVV
jgi:hypothetical protein